MQYPSNSTPGGTAAGDNDASCWPPADSGISPTGIEGLDAVLGGGLPRTHAYLVQGEHGSGKTTLGLQFCLAGARRGERVLYMSTCESEEEIREVARSHGWSLDGVELCALDVCQVLGEPLSEFRGILTGTPQFVGENLIHVRGQDQG
jgi:hypothetical protein